MGWQNQVTGDIGPALIQAALAAEQFLVGPLEPDPGEDLWIECRGRQAIAEGTFPLRALLQVKTTAASAPVFVYDVELKHVIRWAAQPLPVFLIGVAADTRSFYVKSVDEIVAEDLKGQDPSTLPGETARVRLPSVSALGPFLTEAITRHYESLRLTLHGLSESEIEQHYFEVLDKQRSEPWAVPPTVGWQVLWKSQLRPQHFAAMLTELAHRAHLEYATTIPRPAITFFHIYRSFYDLQNNLTVADVAWVDPTLPKAAQIRAVLHMDRDFRVRQDTGVTAIRDFLRTQTATPEEFSAFAERVGQIFDRLADRLLIEGRPPAWDESLKQDLSAASDLWNHGPIQPVQYVDLNRCLNRYDAALTQWYLIETRLSHTQPQDKVARWRRECLGKLRDCRGAWRIFLRR